MKAEPSITRMPESIPDGVPSISVALTEQSPGDDLGLDLRRAFENIEDAGITEHPRDRIFQGVTIAAVDLQGVVRVRPGNAGGQQFRHAGLDVAAPAGIFLPGREVVELTGDHGLDRHPGELPRNPGEIEDQLAELRPLLGVGEAQFQGILGDTDGPCRGLDAGGLESRHQLLETLALLAAQQLAFRNLEIVEALDKMTKDKDATIAQLAIAWLLAKSPVSSVITGVTRMEQLEDNAGATQVELNDSDLKRIKDLLSDV